MNNDCCSLPPELRKTMFDEPWIQVPNNLEYLTESLHEDSLESLKKKYPEWAIRIFPKRRVKTT
jgi:hypothetical protein